MKRLLAFCLLTLIAAGCAPTGSCRLTIAFPDDDARALVSVLEIWVVAGSGEDCNAMIQGTATPGDPGLDVLAHLRLAYPPTAPADALDQVPLGPAAFFIEGRGQGEEIFVRGCSTAKVSGTGTVEVRVELGWVCKPVDEICADAIDNDCDGDTDEGCLECQKDSDCDDLNPCTIDFCTDNECHQVDFPKDTPCSDGDPCTIGDACDAGLCVGRQKDCSAFDGPCNQGACDTDIGECGPQPRTDGTSCDDGQWCTETDSCQAGACVGQLRDCDDGDDCTADSCNEGSQLCDYVLVPRPGAEGPPGDPNCGNGADDDCDGLVDGADPNCLGCTSDADCDDGNPCTADSCEGLECLNSPVADGTACSDGLYCTVADACNQGKCQAAPRDCNQGAASCKLGVCLEDEDRCELRDEADGTPCADGLYCTEGDQCAAGDCIGGQRDCDDGDVCTGDGCDEDNNRCRNELEPVPGAEGLAVGDSCTNSLDDDCDGLTDVLDPDCIECSADGQCDDGNTCTADSCDAGRCKSVSVTDGSACDDGQYCTTGDACIAGACAGALRDCSQMADECHDGVCDEDASACIAQPIADGTACDDGLYCTLSDRCQAGACIGSARDCDDDDACTADDCDEDGDACSHVNQPNPGAEGPPGAGNCQNLADDDCDGLTDLEDPECYDCQAASECDDNNQCTSDDCNWGVCEHTLLPDGTGCDDGAWCTTADSCQAAACGGAPRDCSSLDDACHSGTCDEQVDACIVAEKPDDTPCDDGLFCTLDDVCAAGVCTGDHRDCSGLSDACHDGVCDDGSNACVAIEKDNGTPCSDGLYCTTGDQCTGGACSGDQRDCDDLDVCTIDACDEDNTVCTHTLNPQGNEGPPAGADCINGQDDDCDGLTDISDPDCYSCSVDPDCDDGNLCTADNCTGHVCHNNALADGSACDDGVWCSEGDQCSGGVCGGSLRQCLAQEDACHDGVCDLGLDTCTAVEKPDGTPCDDGNWCSMADSCMAGVCQGSGRDCADSDSCTADGCDDVGQSCTHTWTARPELLDGCGDGIDQDCDGIADGCCLADGTYTAVLPNAIGPDPWYVITAELNADGIPDLATVNHGDNTISVLLGNGSGGHGDATFSITTFATGINPYGLAAADLDGDHLVDIVSANNSGNSLSIQWGQGGGAFGQRQDISFFPVGANPVQVVVGDFNADAIPDLATANWGDDSVAVLLGQGTDGVGNRSYTGPVFHEVGATGVSPRALVAGDFDADGILDLAVAMWNSGKLSVLFGGGAGGRGDGSFGPPARYDAGNSQVNISTDDFNADGVLDLAVVAMSDNAVNILLGAGADGRGDGTFLARTAYATGSTPVSVFPVDLDADGILDLLVAEYGTNKVSLLPGNGTNGRGDGTFAARMSYSVGSQPTAAVALDSSGDGILDLAACNNGPNNVSLLVAGGSGGLGDGTFVVSSVIDCAGFPGSQALYDMNADNILDLALVRSGSAGISIFAGDGSSGRGTAGFTPGWSGTTGNSPAWIAAADSDGDRIRDLLVANRGSGSAGIFVANGTNARGDGTFASQVTYPAGASPGMIALADLDADRIGDLVTVDETTGLGVRLGGGADGVPDGTFGAQSSYAGVGTPVSFALGDVDGDAIIDAVLGSGSGSAVAVLVGIGSNGAGTGAFAAAIGIAVGQEPVMPLLVDLDRDGNLDLVVANRGSNSVSVRPGAGDGSFGAGADYAVGTQPVALASGDFNSDGNLDIVSANSGGGSLSLLLGSGDVTVMPAVQIVVGGSPSAVAACQLDWDGRTDLVVSDSSGGRIIVLRGKGVCTVP